MILLDNTGTATVATPLPVIFDKRPNDVRVIQVTAHGSNSIVIDIEYQGTAVRVPVLDVIGGTALSISNETIAIDVTGARSILYTPTGGDVLVTTVAFDEKT